MKFKLLLENKKLVAGRQHKRDFVYAEVLDSRGHCHQRLLERVDEGDQAQLPHVSGGGTVASGFAIIPLVISSVVRLLKTELAESVSSCCGHGILMIAFPAKAMHIFQPIYVAVFKPSFESVCIFKCMK